MSTVSRTTVEQRPDPGAYAAPDGIKNDVARQLQKVGFSFDQDVLESSLKEVTDTTMPGVEPLGVALVEG